MFCCLLADRPDAALAIARACSPRVGWYAEGAIFDISGCSRTIGPPAIVAREVVRLADAEGVTARVAIAGSVTAAWLLSHACPGPTVALPGAEAATLAPVPVGWLGSLAGLASCGAAHAPAHRRTRHGAPPPSPRRPAVPSPPDYRERLAILARWGLRTLGDFAALPRADVRARLGPVGVRMHQAACGEDAAPFVPLEDAARFEDRLELEWPIDGLEPLAFVLARSCERLSVALERADRGAVVVRTRLRLVTRETHERTLHLPTPLADARTLRTLILLDLESHPPPAAIDSVTVDLDVSPGPVVHGSLFAPTLPTPEDLATLMARLGALMGESRVGSPLVLDTHDARNVGMGAFHVPRQGHGTVEAGREQGQPKEERQTRRAQTAVVMLRRFRVPVATRVTVERGAPVRVQPAARGLAGGPIVVRAGPWRSSGGWWTFGDAWDRDEWDVELASGEAYRLARDRATGHWQLEGVLD